MKFSIITPSYNSGKYIDETIRSIHSQENAEIEHIIMDGGSKDGTLDIIRKYPQIKWVSEKDNGQSDALNKGFARCTGDILAWQNADDLYLPGAFQKVESFFENHPDIDLVYGDYQLVQQDGTRICDVHPIEWSEWKFAHGRFVPMQPATFWRRSVHEKVGPLDQNLHYCMDVDFFSRAAKHFRFARIPSTLGQFRVHEESKTQNTVNGRKVKAEHEMVLARNFDYSSIDHALFNFFWIRSKLARKVKERWLKN